MSWPPVTMTDWVVWGLTGLGGIGALVTIVWAVSAFVRWRHRRGQQPPLKVEAEPIASAVLRERLLPEIGRNENLSGKSAGRPERRYLDEAIAIAESSGLEASEPNLTKALYDLRRQTNALEALAPYPATTINTQYQGSYLPAAQTAKSAIVTFISQSAKADKFVKE